MKSSKMPKARNPMVLAPIMRKGGSVHGKSKKAQRRDERQNLRKEHLG